MQVMACCVLSPAGAALVASSRVATAASSPRLHARVRLLPARRTAARSVSLSCARGRNENDIDACTAENPIIAAIHERRDAKEAAAALVGVAVGVFRPLTDNFSDMRSFRTVFDTEDYHIGMPFGALMACIGLYQLWKVDPSTCLDVALAYGFYKLSVVAADLRRRGISNDLLSRIQLAIGIVMALKDLHKKIVPLDYIRFPVLYVYTVSVLYEVCGLKKYAKERLNLACEQLKTKEGRRELLQELLEE